MGVRGFGALTPERRRELASLGGKAAAAKGTGYRWTAKTAAEAARKGAAGRVARAAARKRLADA